MPGGILKISVPSGERTHKIVRLLRAGLYRSDYATIMPVHPLEHVNTFRRQSIRRIARLTGLRVVQPGLRDAYAFLAVPGALSDRRWKKALKELVRPVYQFRSRSNIYMWLQKPA